MYIIIIKLAWITWILLESVNCKIIILEIFKKDDLINNDYLRSANNTHLVILTLNYFPKKYKIINKNH